MIYSSRISARLALFGNGSTLLDGTSFDPVKEIGVEFDVPFLATINWSVAPTTTRCLPEGNYRVKVCESSLSTESGIHRRPGAFAFSNANLHTLDLSIGYGFGLGPWGFLACGFHVLSAEDVEFYAVDIAGVEIVGSRSRAEIGLASVFFGPGMFAIRATADAQIENVVVISISNDQLVDARHLADVGPAYEPAAKPNPYWNQSYLGHVGLSPLDSLQFRQIADNLARANTAPPRLLRLDNDVHRRSPNDIWQELDTRELVRQTADNFDNIRQQPFWTYGAQVVGADSLEVSAGPMMQLLALAGPVEALSLGQAVTLPVPASFQQANLAADSQSAYTLMYDEGRLPFPIFWLSADFFDTELKATVEEFAIAGFDLPVSRRLTTSAQQVAKRRPQILDGPAFSDVKLWLDRNASGVSFFLSTGLDGTDIVEDINRCYLPKNFLVQTPEPDSTNPLGLPSLQLGPFELPFERDLSWPITAWPRDRFGRWAEPRTEDCTLTPWPVGDPGLQSVIINYAANDTVAARVAFHWDRTTRRQDNVRIGTRFVQAEAEDRGPFDTPFVPDPKNSLTITFDMQGNPFIAAGHGPVGASVQLVKTVLEPVEIGGPATSEVQFYDLVLPLGSAAEVMDNLTVDTSRLFAQIVADAAEKVSGSRRTPEVLPRLDQVIHDPRPPFLLSEPWAITWTSLPNSFTGEARALVRLPGYGNGPAPVAYYVWRAQETAVLNLLLNRLTAEGAMTEESSEALLKVIRRERNMAARLALFKPLIEPRLSDPEFQVDFTGLFAADRAKYIPAADGHLEIILPPHQTGFEFILFTALSRDGVTTEKDPTALMRILAVPDRQLATAPALRIFASDDHGVLEASGLCIALVSHPNPFAKEDVRFFWEAGGGMADADELLFSVDPISELHQAHVAATYISDIDSIVENGISYTNRRFFLIAPPAKTGAMHNFAVDLRIANPATPLDEIPSRRSTIQSLLLR